MLEDGTDPLAAFRLEFSDVQQLAPGEEAAYLIDTLEHAPQLVITFVPEPTTILLAMLGMTSVCCYRRRR